MGSISIPSTPELPVKEPSAQFSDTAANFFKHRLLAESPVHTTDEHPLCVSATDSPSALSNGAHASIVRTTPYTWYRVAFISGIDNRVEPNVDGRRTGVILPRGA